MHFANLPKRPNIIVLMTDQQRAVQYFPKDWVTANLSNLNRLQENGVTFRNGMINACTCTPSRAVLWTGLYAPRVQVTAINPADSTLSPEFKTISDILAPAYADNSTLKGKWHLAEAFWQAASTRPNNSGILEDQNGTMASDYGVEHWDAPDAGTAASWNPSVPPEDSNSNTLGGGPNSPVRNDARYTHDALEFLRTHTTSPDADVPFFLFTSLVNPHDIWTIEYAELMEDTYPEYPAAFDDLPFADRFTIENLPPSYREDDLSTKPVIQRQLRTKFTTTYAENNQLPAIPEKLDCEQALNYLKFYAYLTYLADRRLEEIHRYLEDNDLLDNTIIVRLSDHGEMGMSHGGSMEKSANIYRETIDVPIIFSNPVIWPRPVESDALVGLIDIAPTLAAIAGVKVEPGTFQGKDISSYLLDAEGIPRDCMLFTYDDNDIQDDSYHLRAIRTTRGAISIEGDSSPYKYGVYYLYQQVDGKWILDPDPKTVQYELYNLDEDPREIVNLLPVDRQAAPHAHAVQRVLHETLTNLMIHIDNSGPDAPVTPAPVQDPSVRVGPAVTPYGWSSIAIDSE